MIPVLRANLWLIILVSILVAFVAATGLGLLATYWWARQQVSSVQIPDRLVGNCCENSVLKLMSVAVDSG